MNVFLFINLTRTNAFSIAINTIKLLKELNFNIFFDDDITDSDFLSCVCKLASKKSKDELFNIDYIISIGGDGTTISSSKFAILNDIPIIGINAGRLGFLTTIEGNDIVKLKKLLDNSYTVKKRMVFEVLYNKKSYIAVNDVTIDRDNSQGIIDISVFKDNDFIIKYRADAVLFSTPIGSTGYALSNGGPIADPELEYISMAPICPHSFNAQSYLFKKDVTLNASIGNNQSAYLLVDGKEVDKISFNDKIYIKKSNKYLKIIYLDDIPFYDTLRKKFIKYDLSEF